MRVRGHRGMARIKFRGWCGLLALWQVLQCGPAWALAPEPLEYRAEILTVRSGFDGRTCWVHARAGAIPPQSPGNPSPRPIVVMTLQKLLLDRSDVFYGLND